MEPTSGEVRELVARLARLDVAVAGVRQVVDDLRSERARFDRGRRIWLALLAGLVLLVVAAVALAAVTAVRSLQTAAFDQLGERIDGAVAEARRLSLELEARSDSELRVHALYQTLKRGELEEFVDGLAGAERVHFTLTERALLDAEAASARGVLVRRWLQTGIGDLTRGNASNAVLALSRARGWQPDPELSRELDYHEGIARQRAGDATRAVELLTGWLDSAPPPGPRTLDRTAEAWLSCALALAASGRGQAALDLLQSVRAEAERSAAWPRIRRATAEIRRGLKGTSG